MHRRASVGFAGSVLALWAAYAAGNPVNPEKPAGVKKHPETLGDFLTAKSGSARECADKCHGDWVEYVRALPHSLHFLRSPTTIPLTSLLYGYYPPCPLSFQLFSISETSFPSLGNLVGTYPKARSRKESCLATMAACYPTPVF
jgi:hypothetical protein